jgi:hypothetical protein
MQTVAYWRSCPYVGEFQINSRRDSEFRLPCLCEETWDNALVLAKRTKASKEEERGAVQSADLHYNAQRMHEPPLLGS